MKKVVVTGAGGFLGRMLISKLISIPEIEVLALTSQNSKICDLFGEFENFTIADINSVERADVLINCAFPRDANGANMADGLSYIAGILKASNEKNIGAVINISSQSVYSQERDCPADESMKLNLESKYAVGKYASELLTNTLCRDIKHSNLRMASLIGVGFEQRLTNKFLKMILSGEDIIVADGQQLYSFLDVRDAADAICCMVIKSDVSWREVYNIGSTEVNGLREIADEAADIAREFGYADTKIILKNSDIKCNNSLNSELFFRDFGWKPQYFLRDSLKDILLSYI